MNVAVQKIKPIGIGISISQREINSLDLLFNQIPEPLKQQLCFIVFIHDGSKATNSHLQKIGLKHSLVIENISNQNKLSGGNIYPLPSTTEFEIRNGSIKLQKRSKQTFRIITPELIIQNLVKELNESSIVIHFQNRNEKSDTIQVIQKGKLNHLSKTDFTIEKTNTKPELLGQFIRKNFLSNQVEKSNKIGYILINRNFDILERCGNLDEVLVGRENEEPINLLVSLNNTFLIQTKEQVLDSFQTGKKEETIISIINKAGSEASFKICTEIFMDSETIPGQKHVLICFESQSEFAEENRNEIIQHKEEYSKSVELNPINIELEEERNHLKMLINGSRLGTWDWHIEKDEIILNERWFEILGMESGPLKITYQNWKKLILKEDRNYVTQSMDAVIKGEKEFYDIEYRSIGLNGKIIWIHSTGKLITKNKKPFRIIGIHQDITEKKETESKIRTIEDRNNAIVSTLNEGVVIRNLEGAIISCNSSAEKLLGLTFEQMIGKSSIDPIWKTIKEDGSEFPGEEHPAMRTIKTGESQSDVVMGIIKPNGELTWINVNAHLLYHTDSKIPYAVFTIFHDFTARKKAEEELEKNKNLLNETGRVAHIGGWEFDIYLKQINWTEETYRIHEYDENLSPSLEIIKSFFDENNLPILDNAFKMAIEDGISFDLELKLKTYRKNEKWVRIIGKSKYENERITKIIGSIQDITKLKKQELELQSEKTRLAGIIEGTNVGTWEWNLKDNSTIFNERWAGMLGYTLDELAPISFQTWVDLTHPDDLKYANLMLEKHFSNENAYYDLEIRMRHKNGNWIWILDRGKIVKWDEKGNPVSMAGTHMDITSSKLLEEELKKLSIVAERTSNAVIVSDKFGRITWVNESFTKFSGYKLEEVKGKKPKSLFHYQGTNPDTIKYLHEKLKNLENAKCEIKNRGKFGQEYWIDLEIKPLFDKNENHTGFMAVQADITESRKAKQALKHKNEQLENINKELEQFVYIASHDLQEPLLTIRNCAEIIKSEMAANLDEEMNMYLDFIFQSSERLRELIKGLMQYSRIGRERRIEEVNLNNLLLDIKKDLQFSIEESSSTIKYDELPTVNAYPTELRLLFQNLISNSIKFRNLNTQTAVEITCTESDENWSFMVEDNGIGVDPKNLEKVFIIFKRLHNRDEYEGTGIGLAHCKKIIELHGGKIWMESEKGIGCKVIFTIPKNQ